MFPGAQAVFSGSDIRQFRAAVFSTFTAAIFNSTENIGQIIDWESALQIVRHKIFNNNFIYFKYLF